MARRIEAQVSRDWVWGFTTWNLLFRSALNLSRATDAYLPSFFDEETQDWAQPTGKHVEQAAQQLLLALKGSYIDVTGQPRPVKGDVSKLRYVQGPKPIARQLLTNMSYSHKTLGPNLSLYKEVSPVKIWSLQKARVNLGQGANNHHKSDLQEGGPTLMAKLSEPSIIQLDPKFPSLKHLDMAAQSST